MVGTIQVTKADLEKMLKQYKRPCDTVGVMTILQDGLNGKPQYNFLFKEKAVKALEDAGVKL